jgi:hypothetical protein
VATAMTGDMGMAAGVNNISDQREFIRRLTETIFWCRDAGSLAQPKTSLRTCKSKDLTSPSHQVFSVCSMRSRLLWSSGKRNLAPATDLGGGRLLAYFPDDNLACGVAEVESQGFFDTNWVWMVRNVWSFAYADGAKGEMEVNYLVAWVLPDFIALASGGVDVNPEGCILWLDTLDDAFVRSLRGLGFLC